MEMWVNEVWLFGTAVIFTAVGYFWGKRVEVSAVVESTLDSLIEDGYLKTRGDGASMEILTWQEWNDKVKND